MTTIAFRERFLVNQTRRLSPACRCHCPLIRRRLALVALVPTEDGTESSPISPDLPTPDQEYPDIDHQKTNFDEAELSIAANP